MPTRTALDRGNVLTRSGIRKNAADAQTQKRRVRCRLLVLLVSLLPSHGMAQELQIPPPPSNLLALPPAPLPAAASNNAPPPAKEQPKAPNTAVYPYDDLRRVQFILRPEEDQGYYINPELPGPDRLFGPRLSEGQWEELRRQDAKRYNLTTKVIFPERGPLLAQEKFKQRKFEHSVSTVTPGYVLHDRLLFDQPNFERYGWDLGVLGPPVQLGTFFVDLAILPYRMFSRPFDQIDTSAGKYLPGDDVPLMIYPESFSLTGLAAMSGTYAVVPFLFQGVP